MKSQTKFTLVLVTAYSLFMLWWFLREDAVKPSAKSPAAVTTKPKAKTPAPTASSSSNTRTTSPGKFTFAPAGRVVDNVSTQDIQPAEIGAFQPYLYPGNPPLYEGEPVTAYVRVPSSKTSQALTVNQMGEYPQLDTQPGETVQIRLAFTKTAPDTPVALTSQDGGLIEGGQLSTAGMLDGSRQLAFAYTVSPNRGIHRVTLTTPAGETKTLQFWAGTPMPMKPVTQAK
jgi:hypothetical protein